MVIPPFIHPGDRFHIISTARKISEEEIAPVLKYLENKGFRVTTGKYLFASDHQFAGSDRQRTSDLQNALNDPEIQVIWPARGGYGTHRIVENLDLRAFRKYPKWVAGYSDITVLHQLINSRAGTATLHATMPVNFQNQSERSFELALDFLSGRGIRYELPAHPFNRTGKASGLLTGGNLSIIYSLTGTDILNIPPGAILFIEDLDEYLYHIDRMMMNLKLAGILERIGGMIVGGMSDMNDNTIPFGKNAEEIIRETVSEYEFPVIFGFPSGHIYENLPLPMGVEVNIVAGKEKSEIAFPSIPQYKVYTHPAT